MAKRAAPDEKPYRPLLDADLVADAISYAGPEAIERSASSGQVFEMFQPAAPRRPLPVSGSEAARHDSRHIDEVESEVHLSARVPISKFDQEKRILLTRDESQAIDRMVVALAARLDAQVKVSHVMRALIALLLNAESEIDRRAGEVGRLVRPANGDAQALQNFQREISRVILAGLRDAGPIG